MSAQPNSAASFDVLGVPVSVTTLEQASARIHRWAADDQGRFVCIRDVHGIMQAYDNPELAELHKDAAMVTPDGMPLVWLGKRAGLPVERTCGPDLIDKVLADSASSRLRHYFYGGKPGVASQLKAVFQVRYPGLQVVGAATPPFRELTDEELRALADEIRARDANVVWIGLSTPKQEFLMRRLVPLTSATLIGVGAAFDFHTGAVKRAPHWMQRSGLEFLFRLMREPKRLWRRYLVMAPRFLWLLATRQRHA
jgi:N-acetylglucosaminyldiphosphoundecaprenol N-acetyl-beta-D-mannosaminyltransferase